MEQFKISTSWLRRPSGQRSIILTQNDYDFAGRPPLQVTLSVKLKGSTQSVVVIVMHGKCCSDQTSWQRRTNAANAANALKSYLDTNFSTQKVWVIGDFNDDVDTSIYTGNASPFATIQTKALSDTGIASTVGFPDMINHHLNSNDVAATYIASYGTTTSDHYPVLSRYSGSGNGGAGGSGGGGTGGAAQVIVNEIRANEWSLCHTRRPYECAGSILLVDACGARWRIHEPFA